MNTPNFGELTQELTIVINLKLKYFFLLILFSYPVHTSSQVKEYPFDKWKVSEVKKVNNYTEVDYMNKIEKEILFFCNLVRINPKLFAKTYLQKYLDSTNNNFNTSYVKSLFFDLKNCKKNSVFIPNRDLFLMAQDHALTMGLQGKTGHDNYNKRLVSFTKNKFFQTGENCDYGNEEAIDIFMALLIDDNIPGVGHRKNILDKEFNAVGICIKPHKQYRWNCVMEFGEDPNENKDEKSWIKKIFLQ